MNEDKITRLSRIFSFEKKIREAKNIVELRYIVTNELRTITPYVFAFVGQWIKNSKFKIETVSDIAIVERTSPTTTLIQKMMRQKIKELSYEVHAFTPDSKNLLPAKGEKPLPSNFLWVPCFSVQKGPEAALLLCREDNWTDEEIEYVKHLSATIGHALGSLTNHNTLMGVFKYLRNSFFQFFILLALIASMFIPVKLSTIGKMEIIPKEPNFINSPLNAVAQKMLIENNEEITINQSIILFEKTQLQNDYELSMQEQRIIETELLQAQQSSFNSSEDKAMLARLQGRIKLAKEKTIYQKLLLDKTTVFAPSNGIAVIKDKSLIIGKPFQIGETIMMIADPNKILVEIMVPVKDSITIKKEAKVNIYLDSDPLNVMKAKVIKYSYEPEMTSQNILAYRVTAKLIDENIYPRIGLRGSAKIFGDEVRLYFYLFRKPIIFLRQTFGF